MKLKTVTAFLVWEVIVIGYFGLVMMTRGIPFDTEKQRVIVQIACAGVIVVLLGWAVCRLLYGAFAIAAGLVVGLLVPLILAWCVGQLANHWQNSWGHFMTPVELSSLGLGISIPSAVATAIVGVMVRRRHPMKAVS